MGVADRVHLGGHFSAALGRALDLSGVTADA